MQKPGYIAGPMFAARRPRPEATLWPGNPAGNAPAHHAGSVRVCIQVQPQCDQNFTEIAADVNMNVPLVWPRNSFDRSTCVTLRRTP